MVFDNPLTGLQFYKEIEKERILEANNIINDCKKYLQKIFRNT